MANFVLGNSLDFHEILGSHQEQEDINWRNDDKRHYKKDSRWAEMSFANISLLTLIHTISI